MGVSEAVREALLQASEAKKRLSAVSRENDESKECAQSARRELANCTAYLEVSLRAPLNRDQEAYLGPSSARTVEQSVY